MSEPQPTPQQQPLAEPLADWEAFYSGYRKPGYVPGFEITSKLGGGMFGLVFKARKQSIGKDYAIKFLKVDDGEVRRAVLLELEQVKYFAQVDHPNLVSIEDKGEVDGIPYLVMAYAGAETLRDLLPGDAAARPQLLRLFLQACRGVTALHERSLVHFDLKPANVFLKGSVARVGDYGLSKLVTHSRGSLSMGRGTPYYMAPEMLQRRGDHRSDVYSLGVMLFEVLTGDVPFKGDSEWEVLRLHETAEPSFPDHLGQRERAIIARCMHKDPGRRYQSVDDLLAAFGAPVGVGAAAFDDAGRAEPARPAPRAAAPPPGATAPPGSDEADPYVGLRKATREAYTHASKIARKAMARANKVARRASSEARAQMLLVMGRTRKKHARRARAYVRLHRMNRERRRRARREARAARRAAAMTAIRSGLRLGLLALIALIAVGSTWFGLRRSGPNAKVTIGPGTGIVPEPIADSVAFPEPEWVALADRDQGLAGALLDQGLRQFRARAPLSVESRVQVGALPKFQPRKTALGRTRYREMVQTIEQLHRTAVWDEGLAARAREFGYDALVFAATSLVAPSMVDEKAVHEAANLNRFLTESTGFDGLPLPADLGMPVAERQRLARDQGVLWLWFLNDFGFSQQTWQAYRKLRGL